MNCRDCEDTGQAVEAIHRLPSGTHVCRLHLLKRLGQSPATKSSEANPAPEETMPISKEIDWAKVQTDRDAGMSVKDVAKKHGVHVSTIYLHYQKRGSHPPARKGPRGKRGGFDRTPGEKDLMARTLAELRNRREVIDRAIAALEEIQE